MLNCRIIPFSVILFVVLSSRLFSQGNCSLTASSTSFSVCPGYSSTLTAWGANSYTWTSGSMTAAVISQSLAVTIGTYMVKGETGACKDSLIVTVGQAPPLMIKVAVTSPTTCVESNFPAFSKIVFMNASGAGSYTWLSSAGQIPIPGWTVAVRPPSTTCYTVIGSTFNCSASAVVCVTVIPQFTINVVPAQSTICEGDQIPMVINQISPLAVGSASSFVAYWNGSAGTLNTPFGYSVLASPVSDATYTVEVADARGCYSVPFTVSVNVQECTSSEELEKSEQLQIFPNPCTSFVNVHISTGSEVFVFNGVGEKLDANFEIDKDVMCIKTEIFPPGVYFLRIQSPEGIISLKKIIKE